MEAGTSAHMRAQGVLKAFAQRAHLRFRHAKQDLFRTCLLGSNGGGSLLDVGGGEGIAGEWSDFHGRFDVAVTLNLDTAEKRPDALPVVGDGTQMPFRDHSFDWVLCNAVLEHVPYPRQPLLAEEIRRVCRLGYLVATPDKWFPIDPHTFLPYYQVLPPPVQRRYMWLSPGYMRTFEPLYPIGRRHMRALFPEADVRVLRLGFLPAQLLAIWRRGGLLDRPDRGVGR